MQTNAGLYSLLWISRLGSRGTDFQRAKFGHSSSDLVSQTVKYEEKCDN